MLVTGDQPLRYRLRVQKIMIFIKKTSGLPVDHKHTMFNGKNSQMAEAVQGEARFTVAFWD